MAKVCNFGRWPDSLCLLWCEGSVWAYIGRWGLALNKDICEAFCGEWSLTIWTLQHNWSLKYGYGRSYYVFPLHISSSLHEGGPYNFCCIFLLSHMKVDPTSVGSTFMWGKRNMQRKQDEFFLDTKTNTNKDKTWHDTLILKKLGYSTT